MCQGNSGLPRSGEETFRRHVCLEARKSSTRSLFFFHGRIQFFSSPKRISPNGVILSVEKFWVSFLSCQSVTKTAAGASNGITEQPSKANHSGDQEDVTMAWAERVFVVHQTIPSFFLGRKKIWKGEKCRVKYRTSSQLDCSYVVFFPFCTFFLSRFLFSRFFLAFEDILLEQQRQIDVPMRTFHFSVTKSMQNDGREEKPCRFHCCGRRNQFCPVTVQKSEEKILLRVRVYFSVLINALKHMWIIERIS